MKIEFNSYGSKFIFDKEKNKKILNFNWLIDVLQKEIWEPVTFKIFDNHKNKNKIAIDIGGWIGITTIYLSKIFKQVITVEADKISFNVLAENIKENFCNNVSLINKAFHNSKTENIFFGTNSFNFDSNFGSSTSHAKLQSNNNTDYLIKTINIFDIIKQTDPNNIGLIKIDIEGGDEDVFEELILVGAEYNWKIWISFHYGWWKDKNVMRFKHLLPYIKKVSRDTTEISKYDLLSLIEMNVPESFLIEL